MAKIIEMINEFPADDHNIAILLPFGNSGKESVEYYHNALIQRGIKCSKYYNEMKTDNIYIDKIHVTTFKSSKGLEFNTVIIPFLHKFQDFISRPSSKASEHDYYVALTRARDNLYLLSSHELDFIDTTAIEIEQLDITIPFIEINENEIPFRRKQL
ncbi:MAG: 3'-5' exonuclease [Sulfurovum sp.]|nr:3'-5' exonuclease [Sulfurovum sp.]